jgi:hypothetical protein
VTATPRYWDVLAVADTKPQFILQTEELRLHFSKLLSDCIFLFHSERKISVGISKIRLFETLLAAFLTVWFGSAHESCRSVPNQKPRCSARYQFCTGFHNRTRHIRAASFWYFSSSSSVSDAASSWSFQFCSLRRRNCCPSCISILSQIDTVLEWLYRSTRLGVRVVKFSISIRRELTVQVKTSSKIGVSIYSSKNIPAKKC